jgi:hypothetical protein
MNLETITWEQTLELRALHALNNQTSPHPIYSYPANKEHRVKQRIGGNHGERRKGISLNSLWPSVFLYRHKP